MRLEEIGEKTYLNEGLHGICYELENETVLKLFNASMPLFELKKFKYMMKHKNKSFLFPFDFVYDNERFYGYIMRKSLGQTLEKIFCGIDLEKFAKHSIKLEKDIMKISKAKILLNDFHEGNIMYNGKRLEVVDFDSYKIEKYTSEHSLIKQNLQDYKNLVIGLFEDSIGWDNLTPHIEYVLSAQKYMHNNIFASETVLQIKEEMEKYYKEKIKTINDLNAILKK